MRMYESYGLFIDGRRHRECLDPKTVKTVS